MDSFGEILTKLRKEKGLTQEDLADIFQISRQSVSKWETNTTFPETDKLVSMAKYFNVSLDLLINSEKISNIELSSIEKIKENELVNVNEKIAFEEKTSLQKNDKVNKLFSKRRINLLAFFLILVIGIPVLIYNLESKNYKIGDIVETAKKINLQVKSVNYPGNIGAFDPGSGLTYVLIEIEITNINETAITIIPDQFEYCNKLSTQTSNNGSMIFFSNTSFSEGMFFKNELDRLYGVLLEPNIARKGYLIFASPFEARRKQKLVYTEIFAAENKKISYAIVIPNVP